MSGLRETIDEHLAGTVDVPRELVDRVIELLTSDGAASDYDVVVARFSQYGTPRAIIELRDDTPA